MTQTSVFSFIRGLILACISVGTALVAHGQTVYPTRNIQLINPFPPGGTSDIIARSFAHELGAELGQTVYVDNKAGAGGTVGAEFVSRAVPDGYTLLLSNSSMLAVSPLLYTQARFNVEKDLSPVVVLVQGANVLLVNTELPVKSLAELVAFAKAKPGTLNFGSTGGGTTTHLAGEMLKQMTGTQIQHVPYRGAGPAMTALLAGDVQMMFDNIPSAIQQIRSGKVRPIAVTGPSRVDALPSVPTMQEAGLPRFEVTGWFSLSAPEKTPKDVIARLNAAAQKVLQSAEFQKRIAELGYQTVGGSPEKMAEMTRAEVARWTPIVKASGAKIE